uniref:Uncharacterized protein n=1 Tax=Avena sativa TaxID=4498 RepID=A0ACD5WXE4_AVESA
MADNTTAAAAEAKTSVWWDINWCAVPPGCGDAHRIAHNVIAALAAAGCKGPVSVFAYGDASRIAPGVLEALSSTGISLNHVAAGVKDGVDKKMLVDMVFWAYDNPPPGNYLLISGDQDFSDLLHKLKMKKYEILLAQPPNVSSRGLFSAAKLVWLWESLAAGEPLLAKSPHSHTVPNCNRNSNNLDASKNFPALYNKSDSNVKARAKPIQIYIKSNITSTSASNEGQVEHVDGVSEDSTGSTVSELDRSSVSSSSSSSESIEGTKLHQSSLLGTPTLSQSSAKKPEVPAHLRQMDISQRFITGEEPSISTECASRNGTLDGISNGQYHQMHRQSKSSKAYAVDIDNNLKGGKEFKVKPLQKYVKKSNIASSSGNQVDCSVGNTRSELHLSTASSSSSSKSMEGATVDPANATPPATSMLFQSSAQKPLASIRLHQVIAPQKSILGKKPSTSAGQKSRDGNHGPGISLGHYQKQPQSSHMSNKLHSKCNIGENNGKSGNLYKAKQHQEYVRKTDIVSSSASNDIHLRFPSNSQGSTSGLSSQSVSSLFCSDSLDGAKVNPLFSLSSAQKSDMPTHSHQEGGEFLFGKEPSVSVVCYPTNKQNQSSVFLKQDNSGPPNPHSAFGQSYSINPDIDSSVLPLGGHNGVPSSQLQTWPSGSTFQGLDDICSDMSRLTISECLTRLPSQGIPANYPSFSMPNVSGHPRDLHEVKYSFHAGSNITLHPNHSGAPPSVQPPPSDSRPPQTPSLSCSIRSSRNHGETQGSPPNCPEHEGTVRSVLHALGILKTEKISPTESNIADCIRYGEMNLPGFDTKKALELAIRNQAVIMKKLVNDMPLFVAKDESLWKCVDVTNSSAKRPKSLETLRKFISSAGGYSAIKNSQSGYEAATILKKLCFQQHTLGDVLQILQIAITRKKWLVPHSSGWQPLSFNTVVVDATGDAIGEVAS